MHQEGVAAMRTYRWVWAGGTLLVLGLLLMMAFGPRFGMMGQGQQMGPGMMYGMGGASMMAAGPGGWAMMVGWLAMIVFWGTLIGGAVLLIMRPSKPGYAEATSSAGAALAIAQRRYAAGEIDRDTFAQMRQDLQEGSLDLN